MKSLGASVVDNENGLCEIVSGKSDVKLILEPRLLILLRKKWVLEEFAEKNVWKLYNVDIHTHDSILHTFHMF